MLLCMIIKMIKFWTFNNGKVDLQKGILKMIDEKTFQEDPLRILRLAQLWLVLK